jgi:hypothetical protein
MPKVHLSGYLLLLLVGWFVFSYCAVSPLSNKRFSAELVQHARELDHIADTVSYNFDRSLPFLTVIPTTIADSCSHSAPSIIGTLGAALHAGLEK